MTDDREFSNDTNAEIAHDDYLLAISTDQYRSRSAVSATFRGFCSEAFVYGKCARQNSGCTFDHSTAGQERCINSFTLLAKRELQQHGQLEPWSSPKQEASNNFKTNNAHGLKNTSSTTFHGATKPSFLPTSTRPYQK